MKRSAFLKRVLLLLLLSIAITALMTGVLFFTASAPVFANEKADELRPRAHVVAEYYLQYYNMQINLREFQRAMAISGALTGTQLQIYDTNGDLILYSSQSRNEFPFEANSDEMIALTTSTALQAMKKGHDVISTTQVEGETGDYLVVSVPVVATNANGQGVKTVGAVVLTMPYSMLRQPLTSINKVLVFCLLAVYIVLCIPLYFAVRKIGKPILQMRDIAMSMANGDFTVRADESMPGEVGELAHSLNYLSERLGESIDMLTLERNRLQQLIDGITEGLLALDSNGEVTHVNPALIQMLRGDGETDDETAMQLIAGLTEDMQTVRENREPMEKTQRIHGRWLRMIATPLMEGDVCAGTVALFHDITETERLEQTRKDYVANVSHELRTPLSSIRGLTEALNDGMIKTPEARTRYYGYILRECMRLSRLIDDLLELSRLQSGNVALKKEAFSLTPLLQDVQMRYQTMADEMDIHLCVQMPAQSPIVYSNSDRIEQVLIILLDNAFKFTPEDGTVYIELHEEADRVLVSVRDTGCGIEKEDLPNVFERFYKADKAHTGHGTGLGLSIAREIMGLLGETIGVQSTPGKGATFTFTIARAQ